ncbi:hypothetical protein ES703_90646 [subsurface metagenome]
MANGFKVPKFDPKELVDSVGDGVVGAVQIFPRAAENIAGVAHAYAGSVNRSIDDFKAKMPDEPAVIPRMLGSIVGETVGAALGVVEAVVRAGTATAADIKSQIGRGTK